MILNGKGFYRVNSALARVFIGTGTRITGYFANTILQLRWVGDVNGEHGAAASMRVGQSWAIPQLEFPHPVLSADWLSNKAANYWIGVSPQRATRRFPAYEGRGLGLPLGGSRRHLPDQRPLGDRTYRAIRPARQSRPQSTDG